MSVRIIAPPARVLPIHDDGAFRLTTSTVVDDDGWRPFFWPQIAPNIVVVLSDDEVSSTIVLDDDSIIQSWSVVAKPFVIAQPIDVEDDLPPSTPTIRIDDDGFLALSIAWRRIASQPYADDEVGAQLKKFGIEDERTQPAIPILSSVFAQPIATEIEWIPLVAIDDDPFTLTFTFASKALPQPISDDEIGVQLKNFGLEYETGGPPSLALCALYAQPSAVEIEWIPLVAIDEDPYTIFFTFPVRPYSQPISDDETGSQLKNFGLDDDGYATNYCPVPTISIAQQWQWTADELIVTSSGTVTVGNRTYRMGSRSVRVAVHSSKRVEIH
jgi:hypothetical protein